MTAYLSRGDKAILYAGNLNIGALNGLIEALRNEGVEVFPPVVAGREPAGPPTVLAVITEPEECRACGWSDASRGRGLVLDGAVIVDEVSRLDAITYDCPDLKPHHPHVWFTATSDGGARYCKGATL